MIQAEEFKGEPMPGLHYKVRNEQQPKVFKQATLIYPVTLKELPNDRYL